MAPKLAKGMDPLACLASDDSDDSEAAACDKDETSAGAARDADDAAEAPTHRLAAAPVVDYEALQRAGYRGGPSVLFVPERKPEAIQDWNWSRGARHARDTGGESAEEREALQHAAGAGVTEAIERQLAAAEHAKRLREAAIREELEARQQSSAKEREKLSFNQREKRKRERGQQSTGRNFVEEEKRVQRAYGQYSGFD